MKGKSSNIPDKPTDPQLYDAWITQYRYAIESADLADGASGSTLEHKAK